MKLSMKSIWRSMRRQSVLSLVTMAGTALAVFLIMVVVMMNEVPVAPYAPESARDRMLHYTYAKLRLSGHDGVSSGQMSYATCKTVFYPLETPQETTVYDRSAREMTARSDGGGRMQVNAKLTDERFWRVFDFTFVDGKPYTKADVDAALRRAVISDKVARRMFGTVEVTGRELKIDNRRYMVAGVVKEVSRLADHAYGDVWLPLTTGRAIDDTWNNVMGSFSATMVAPSADKDSIQAVRRECRESMARYNSQLADTQWEFIVDDDPRTHLADTVGSEKDWRRRTMAIYLILLIVPAVNLSSMTESRLTQRTAEFGVRRAFGCTRREIMAQIVVENMLVTLVAGVLGFAMSVAFALVGGEFIFRGSASLTELLHGSTFAWALGMCFVLNLMSASVPAFRAARRDIVTAIAGQRK